MRFFQIRKKWMIRSLLIVLALVSLLGVAIIKSPTVFSSVLSSRLGAGTGYVVLAWNDLGMHCYNLSFKDLGVLPPFNNLKAQVIKLGDPPTIVTEGITIEYSFPGNTESISKTDFWNFAQQLFGLPQPLPPNIGLTGKGLTGTMDLDPATKLFSADGIPLTEFMDGTAPTPPNRVPYQLATVIVKDTATGTELARTTTVAPVSTEMHCEFCHSDGGVGGFTTGSVERNILSLHDSRNQTNLNGSRPVLCANCHASNALNAPGNPNLPNFSKAMHFRHRNVTGANLLGCYDCHPGPQTQCLRDVMFVKKNFDCLTCHGSMLQVSQNPNPWLNEPRCDSAACHPKFTQDQPLYRNSRGHSGIFCEGCHDSTHAIAPSREPRDAIKFIGWQGFAGTLRTCTVCHLTQPQGAGPHNITRRFLPAIKGNSNG